jgi:hypothetical protein
VGVRVGPKRRVAVQVANLGSQRHGLADDNRGALRLDIDLGSRLGDRHGSRREEKRPDDRQRREEPDGTAAP